MVILGNLTPPPWQVVVFVRSYIWSQLLNTAPRAHMEKVYRQKSTIFIPSQGLVSYNRRSPITLKIFRVTFANAEKIPYESFCKREIWVQFHRPHAIGVSYLNLKIDKRLREWLYPNLLTEYCRFSVEILHERFYQSLMNSCQLKDEKNQIRVCFVSS